MLLPIERTLERIWSFDAAGAHCLSIYLTTDPARDAGRNPRAELQDLARPLLEQEPDPLERTLLQAELDAVSDRVAGLDPRPRGVAVFACAARGFLDAVPLPDRVPPAAYWNDHLHLTPLIAAVDEHERTLAVLTDKERGRFFRMFLGTVTELPSVVDDIPGKHAQGGDQQRKISRDHDMHVHWHAKAVVERLTDLDRAWPVDRILIGGPPEVLADLKHLLPGRIRGRVRGEVRAPLYASAGEVQGALLAAGAAAEREQETALLDHVLDRAGAGCGALTPGVVLEAAREGRVAVLVYAAGLRRPGGRCRVCERLFFEPVPELCPACASAIVAVPDIVDALVHLVVQNGGRIDEVHGEAEDRLLPQGGLAALLRGAWSPAEALQPF
jgi:peptide subunit release factor 1 (eRF1)